MPKKAIYNGGTVAYGFKIVDQRYKIEPAEAEVVRWVFERFTKGYTRKEIVDLLKEKDIRTKRGNDFTVGAITRLLKNRKYMGDYKFDDTVVEGAIEPIVDKSVFEEAQKLLKARMKNKHAKENCHYLFSGKIVCAHCKQNYIADSGTSRNGTVHKYYTCRGKKIHNGCKNKNFKKDELEDLILTTTLNDVLTSETIPKIAKHTVKALKHSRETDTALKVLEKDLKETLKRRDNIMQAIEMGVVTDSTLSRLKELEDRIAELTTKIELEKNKKPLPTVEAVEWYLYDFSTANLTDEHDRQKLTNMLIKKIVVDDNLVTIIYNSYDYRHSLECSDMAFMVHLENVKLNQIVYLDPYTFCYSFHIEAA